MEHHELVCQITNGGRFVTFPYVVSIVIFTFQRNLSGVKLVRTGNWPMHEVISATIITSLAGWWGLPFGPIYSILSLYHLWHGGRDATKEILTNALGGAEAVRILPNSPKPEPPKLIWVARIIILLQLGLAVWLWMALISAVGNRPS
jgi:hypothetical protein